MYQTNNSAVSKPGQDSFKQGLTRNTSSIQIGGSTTAQFPNSINYTTINQYQVGASLGQGNYAQVKAAVHKETGFVVAIKIYDKFKIYANQ